MANVKVQIRRKYRDAFKNGKDVWYLSRYKNEEPHVWTKVDKNHVWKDSKYWYAFTEERWITDKKAMDEFCKTHILLPSGKWVKK